MSYCRFSEGDVYLIGTYAPGTEEEVFYCCGCLLNPRQWVGAADAFLGGYLESVSGEPDFLSPSRGAAYSHLEDHVDAGHYVPRRAFDGLIAETEWGQP